LRPWLEEKAPRTVTEELQAHAILEGIQAVRLDDPMGWMDKSGAFVRGSVALL